MYKADFTQNVLGLDVKENILQMDTRKETRAVCLAPSSLPCTLINASSTTIIMVSYLEEI